MIIKLLKYLGINLLIVLMVSSMAKAVEVDYATKEVQLQLITKANEVNADQDIQVLLKFKMLEGWHILSPVPGDIGLPTVVNWTLPFGYELTNDRWSAAQKFGDDEIMQYGYANEAYYLATIHPDNNHLNNVDFNLLVSWQACKDECIPQTAKLHFKLPITKNNVIPNKTWYEHLQAAENTFMLKAPKATSKEPNLLIVLIMAFAGGMVLNLMPCIFPILSLKAISLVKHSYSRRKARADAILYIFGVVVSFLFMASLLVFLRKQGENVGWGFQLQSPVFVMILIGIFLLIMLMLLDVVNLQNPFANGLSKISMRTKYWGSFFTGVFSVIIATPCTAPFMGIAIGYTLTKPIYVYYPVFLALALGYALPFALIGFFPKVLSKILPKPGKWMIRLKQIFAIPIFLTCVWLVWVLYNQFSDSKQIDKYGLDWRVYNAEDVAYAVNNGQKVFVDFTAKWCLTCLANEKIAINTKDFAEIIKKQEIMLFKADWTNRDDKITKALEHYGRNSIPLYVYYNGKKAEMIILPQLLTPGIVRDNLM